MSAVKATPTALGVALTALLLLPAPDALGEGRDGHWHRLGLRIVQEKCAGCHAVGRTGESPRKDAPPFRLIARKYPVESLAEALAEGIVTGHEDMPQFVFPPGDVRAILAYWRTLNSPSGR